MPDTEKVFQSRMEEFGWFEYVIFFSLLFLSAMIGVYHAIRSKSGTVEEYMLGGRSMPLVPVAISLIASFVSGITLLGIPSETYLYGTQMYAIVVAIIISFVLLNVFYLPVFYNLKFKSFYEYLEKRFDKSVRSISSLVFTLSIISNVPVVMYVPTIAFNQVTGMSIYYLAPILCAVCIFYTSIGGLKAVVWSDALQGMFTVFSMIVVLWLGIVSVRGWDRVMEISRMGERLEFFNMDLDPTMRATFMNTAFGSMAHWLTTLACHPSAIQRYISLPTYKQAQLATLLMCLGVVLLKTLSTATGLVIYAKYYDCDPTKTKEIDRPAQILPFYILDVARNWPGLAGLFLSGVVSSALSTMSTGLNTLAGTLYEDFLKTVLPWKQTEKSANLTIKFIVVILGVITTALVFLVERLGTIVQVAVSLHGVTTGVKLYIFTLGIFVPWANAKGAWVGTVVGLLSTATMMTGNQMYQKSGDIYYGTKVLSVEGCPANLTAGLNATTFGHPGVGTVVQFSDSVPSFFRISFLYYALVGFVSATTAACVVSLLTGLQDPAELDLDLLVPQLRRFFRPRHAEPERGQVNGKEYRELSQLDTDKYNS